MSNKVLITNSQKAIKVPSGLRILIRRACNAVLEYEHFDDPAEISVTFVDNAAIVCVPFAYPYEHEYTMKSALYATIKIKKPRLCGFFINRPIPCPLPRLSRP